MYHYTDIFDNVNHYFDNNWKYIRNDINELAEKRTKFHGVPKCLILLEKKNCLTPANFCGILGGP